MTSTSRSLLFLLGLALAATPACKKTEESTPPEDLDIDDEADADDDADDDDGDDDDDAPEEALTQTLFEEQVQANMDDVLECYMAATADNPELAGKVIVSFTIAGDGSVETTEIDEASTLNDEGMNSCLQGKLSGWSFSKPPTGEPMVLSFPFSLTPAQ